MVCDCCCYSCCSPPFCKALWCTIGQVCGGAVAYMVFSVAVFEGIQCCCSKIHRDDCFQHCCNCCDCKKNAVESEEVEPPNVHIMIRNPDGTMNLGTVSAPINLK